MTVSSVSSSPYQTNAPTPWQQRAQDFKALANALQSGDLTGAQQAFAALQKDQPGSTSTTSASGQNSQASNDFQSLQNALQSGDLSGAQQAFASLKQDLQGAHRGHHHHHHRSTQNTSSGGSGQNNPLASDMQTLQSALQSGDLSSAQQAFANFQKDLQTTQSAHHHHHHAANPATSGQTDAASSATAATTVGGTLDTQA